jgi:pimeloyl-ACP methyl ester carboxylesterase/RimJ/RimL family protein N-acetyltransferase
MAEPIELPVGPEVSWTPARFPERVPLPGDHVLLRPLTAADAEQLYVATHWPQGDPAVWTYMADGPYAGAGKLRSALAEAEASQDPLFYAIVRDGRVLGRASYLRITPAFGVIEIGNIVFAPALQRTTAATEAIYLLARHAFDDLGYRRLEWKCNALNAASRRAADRFGFAFEGVFRNHQIVKGRNRDTAWYAIVDADWPEIRSGFQAWLSVDNFDRAGLQRAGLARLRHGFETARLRPPPPSRSPSTLTRDGVTLAHADAGSGEPAVVLVHGIACHRGFMAPQARFLRARHRVVAVDLRGHGDSDAPQQRYTIEGLADDVGWVCEQLGIEHAVVVGHSLGGLVALELAATRPDLARAAALIDSVLLAGGDRPATVAGLVAGLRGPDGDRVLRDYFRLFFGPHDDPAVCDWILDQAVRTPAHVISSIWEEASSSWDDADALARCRAPLLYLDAGTPNADLPRAVRLNPSITLGRTVGTGHFSQLICPAQVNAMLERFLAVGLSR